MALFAFPAWEVVRVLDIKTFEINWQFWFEQAGGRCWDNRMIALKTDGVWERLLGSMPAAMAAGMGLRQVPSVECIELGLVIPDPEPEWHGTVKIDGVEYKSDDLKKLRDQLKSGALKVKIKITK